MCFINTGDTSRIRTNFYPHLVFAGGSSYHYEMALIKETNNCVKIGVTWKSIKIPIVCYEINKLLQCLIVRKIR